MGTDGLGNMSLNCHPEGKRNKQKNPTTLTWSACDLEWEIIGDFMADMFVFGKRKTLSCNSFFSC